MAANNKLLKTSSALKRGHCAVDRENSFPSATEAFGSSRELCGFWISNRYNPEGYFVCNDGELGKKKTIYWMLVLWHVPGGYFHKYRYCLGHLQKQLRRHSKGIRISIKKGPGTSGLTF